MQMNSGDRRLRLLNQWIKLEFVKDKICYRNKALKKQII